MVTSLSIRTHAYRCSSGTFSDINYMTLVRIILYMLFYHISFVIAIFLQYFFKFNVSLQNSVHKSYKDSTETFHPFPLLFTSSITMVCLSQLITNLATLLLTKLYALLRFHEVSLMFLFRSRVPFRTQHYISLSCLLVPLLTVTVSHTFLVFDDFDIKEVFCRMPPNLDLSDFFFS